MGRLLPVIFGRPPRGGVAPMKAITCITTGAGQTLTLQQLTPTGGDCEVNWGDGGATSTISDGNVGATTHVYTSAGTYHVMVSNPHLLTVIDLRDSKIVLDTGSLGGIVPENLTTLYLSGLGSGTTFNSSSFSGATPSVSLWIYLTQTGTYTFDSADFSGATPSANLFLSFSQVGTYAFDSADFNGSTPSVYLSFNFTQAGTYAFDSADFSGTTPSAYLSLSFAQTGTYTFDSADFNGATPSSYLLLSFPQAGTYTFDSADFSSAAPSALYLSINTTVTTTIARADWTGIVRNSANPSVLMGLDQTEVDAVLLGIYDDFANRTATNGTLAVAGSNAAPSGTLQAQCPPTTGKEAAYELVNDSCGVSANHYAAVTISA